MTTKDQGITLPGGGAYVNTVGSTGVRVTDVSGDYSSKNAYRYGAAVIESINLFPATAVAPTDLNIYGQDGAASFAAPGGNIYLLPGRGSVGNASGNVLIRNRDGNGGTWNTPHIVAGVYHLWIDANARLRIKTSAPANDTDGFQVASYNYTGSATYDPPSLSDGTGATTTVAAAGASLGDFAVASFSLDLQGVTVTAWVSSANVVSVRFQNESGGLLDLGSGTLKVRVIKQ